MGDRRERDLFRMGRTSFLSALGYRRVAQRRQWVRTWYGKCLPCLLLGVLFFLNILYEKHDGTFQPSHAYLSVVAWLFFVAWFWCSEVRRRITGWVGLDDIRPGYGWIIWFVVSALGGLMLSIYVVGTYAGSNAADVTITPAVVGFSVPIISAMLAGLAITAANYPKIARDHRAEMLRVAQKFVLATVLFILFVVAFFLLLAFQKRFGEVDPNKLAWGVNEIYGGVLFWLSGLSLFLGSGLFILGAGEFVSVLVKLRRGEDAPPS